MQRELNVLVLEIRVLMHIVQRVYQHFQFINLVILLMELHIIIVMEMLLGNYIIQVQLGEIHHMVHLHFIMQLKILLQLHQQKKALH